MPDKQKSFLVLGGEGYARPIRDALPGVHVSHKLDSSYEFIGVLFTGGTDVDPDLYGEKPHPRTSPPDFERDAFEQSVWEWAKTNDIPCFGICRGSQFLYVMNGGTLRQHIEGHGIMGTHKVWAPGHIRSTHMSLDMTSTHHQCAAYPVPKGVKVTLEGLAGASLIIEAWENMSRRDFGIQGHPEYMDRSSVGYQYFRDLVTEHANR